MKIKLFILLAILFYLEVPINVQANTNIVGKNVPRADFIDVSSWQGYISAEEFKQIKNIGIQGVVVKVTEGTTYINPFAYNQIHNAKKAGLKVSGYHFSRYKNHDEASMEARFFFESALKSGLEKKDVFVNDAEHEDLIRPKDQMTSEAFTFKNELTLLGINTTDIYMTEYWKNQYIDLNKLGEGGWIASYPVSPTHNQNWHSKNHAWQWSDKLQFNFLPGIYFDVNQDYSGIYTKSIYTIENTDYYIVQDGDSLYSIGKSINVPWITLAKINNISNPYLIKPGQKLRKPDNSYIYTVQENDTLSQIAEKTNISISSLLQLNPKIINRDLIYPFQKIILK